MLEEKERSLRLSSALREVEIEMTNSYYKIESNNLATLERDRRALLLDDIDE